MKYSSTILLYVKNILVWGTLSFLFLDVVNVATGRLIEPWNLLTYQLVVVSVLSIFFIFRKARSSKNAI